MLDSFLMNGYLWRVKHVHPEHPMLVDRTGILRVATTDPMTHTTYLADDLEGDFLSRVLLHELGHCVMFSYGLLPEIHRYIHPKYWIEMEEWICNFIADYGREIFFIAYQILGEEAWMFIPYELERLVS